MAGSTGYRFMALLLVLYLASTAVFLLFIQHTSERHLAARHPARSPLLIRRAQMQAPPPPKTPRDWHTPPRREMATGLVRGKLQAVSAEVTQTAVGSQEQTAGAGRPPKVKVAERGAGKPSAGDPGPLILFRTPLWGRLDNWQRFFGTSRLGQCRARCSFTTSESRQEAATLVVFSAADLSRAPPPSEAGRLERLPRQLWALLTLDPPPARIRLQPHQLDGLFNWTISYRRDADVPLVYGRVAPLTGANRRAAPVRLSPGRRALFRPQLCRTRSRREEYVRELGRHMDVDVLGPCGNGTCDSASRCLADHAGNHTFYLALEAADCSDFVSARLYQALRSGLIPVVRGGADYTRLAPPNSFIDAAQFSGPAALARHLCSMSDAQLRRHHHWRYTHQVLPADWACEVCKRLHRVTIGGQGVVVPAHGGDQLIRWWERGRCRGDRAVPPAV